ncbi:GNAT family N-acetyltransferase [Aquisalimonas sp. APHAB1-3]|uniref:GNAT family N-acetyltransferase n=1 Tax=Aquisalimonas sp. APHAB1-3 TaxID=3402080 RepID=UPI003AAE9613
MEGQPDMNLRLREVSKEDYPLIRQWLHANHVRSTWGDPHANLRLLSEPPAHGARRAIIEADGRKVGIVLWQHPSRDELDAAGLSAIPASVIDIDIMIGEPAALGSGFGSSAISRVTEAALFDRRVPFVMACARSDNLASQHAFAKAGFRTVREFDDVPNGRYVLMVRERPESAEPTKELSPRFWDIFFEVYASLPRQGPGSRACAARALGLCHDLPPFPVILDLGCGVGGQTLQLAEMTRGSILAIDSSPPSIERLRTTVAERGLSQRVSAFVGDMAHLEQPPESFDLIWSEGALYSVGLLNALHVCYGLLRPGGYLAFTDAVWREEHPPPEVKTIFDLDYPTMGELEDDLAAIQDCGFELVGHFTLPDEAWWDDFYTPMEARIAELR